MVSVAKNLDGPIKLKFPKHLNPLENKDFNMIVILLFLEYILN